MSVTIAPDLKTPPFGIQPGSVIGGVLNSPITHIALLCLAILAVRSPVRATRGALGGLVVGIYLSGSLTMTVLFYTAIAYLVAATAGTTLALTVPTALALKVYSCIISGTVLLGTVGAVLIPSR